MFNCIALAKIQIADDPKTGQEGGGGIILLIIEGNYNKTLFSGQSLTSCLDLNEEENWPVNSRCFKKQRLAAEVIIQYKVYKIFTIKNYIRQTC